jgi:hypothetical protein
MLRLEFSWAERTARNFMAVAQQFGKSATLADLPIQPSAAYLLAAPAVPDLAREVAIEKAKTGEQITVAKAKEIMAEARKDRPPRRQKPFLTETLKLRLLRALERYKERWNPRELSLLAKHLRDYADSLEKPQRGRKKKPRE